MAVELRNRPPHTGFIVRRKKRPHLTLIEMAQNIYGGDVTSSGISGIPYVQDYQTFPSTFYPANFQPTSQAPPQPNSASSYADLKYLFGVQDTSLVSVNKSGRSRKRSGPGGEHVKHRRTRSGCYTCRTRRVKVRSYIWNTMTAC